MPMNVSAVAVNEKTDIYTDLMVFLALHFF